MRRLLVLLAAATGLTAALPASAQFARPEDAIKYRKSVMTVMGRHLGQIGAMVTDRAPWDPAKAASDAEVILVLSKLPFHAFGPGTESGDTKANPYIWKEPAEFNQRATEMQEAVSGLHAAAKTADKAVVRAALGKVGGSCKGCHDNFRLK